MHRRAVRSGGLRFAAGCPGWGHRGAGLHAERVEGGRRLSATLAEGPEDMDNAGGGGGSRAPMCSPPVV